MDKEIDSVLDLQIEVVQVSIYCEIIKDIFKNLNCKLFCLTMRMRQI